jgi:uncharacterized protein (TIGR02466 family)
MFDQPQLQGIFPLPIMLTSLQRELTQQELDFFEETQKSVVKNPYNFISEDTYLLNQEPLAQLKADFEMVLNYYFKMIYNPRPNIGIRFTQSWMAFTPHGGEHHKHNHPNSLISGVFYINANPEVDVIKFHSPNQQMIAVQPEQHNEYTTGVYTVKVGAGDFILFPSWLEHSVPVTTENKVRKIIAFNAFPTGVMGDTRQVNELIL